MLYMAEKPELARAIVDGLGGGSRMKGYYQCGEDRVTWCFGHMLELCEPEDIEPSLKKWRMEDLPIFFLPWKKKPIPDSKEQFAVVVELLRDADAVVHAGDPDAEGQLLIDEVLKFAGYQGPVKRVLINDNTLASVRKALAAMRDNAEFAGLSAAAEARQVADKMYGYTLTRLYTLAARAEGHPGLISVGRVQTPILGLIVRRDREHENHVKTSHYTVKAAFRSGDARFTGVHQPLASREDAQAITDSLAGKTARVVSFDVRKSETPPPLPYSLLKLQADAARLLGLKPGKVKDITQSLRNGHRLVTYNRSDCRYLPDEHHGEAPEVIAAVAANDPEFAGIPDLDPRAKSRAFNSAKVTAHHAIVPTRSRADLSKLTEGERAVYRMICRSYLAQFLPAQEWEKTTITVDVDGHTFTHRSRRILKNGWCAFLQTDPGDQAEPGDADGAESDDDVTDTIPALEQGQKIVCESGECVRGESSPKPLYSMSSLLNDLTCVAKYARDDKVRTLLIDKDRGKEGENGGIGTPATRDEVINTLFERGFVETGKNGKSVAVVSTALGREVYDALPDDAKYPDLAALWHERQRAIERGEITSGVFLDELLSYLGGEVARVTTDGLGLKVRKHPCPKCGSVMWKRSGKNGLFWGCSKFPGCTATLPDNNGEPGKPRALTFLKERKK